MLMAYFIVYCAVIKYPNKCTSLFLINSLYKKMKFSIKDFSSKCGQIRRKLRNLVRFTKVTLNVKLIFCAVTHEWLTLDKAFTLFLCFLITLNSFKLQYAVDLPSNFSHSVFSISKPLTFRVTQFLPLTRR